MTAKILIIEDNEPIALIQKTLLEKNQYDVRHAETGAEGLKIAREWLPEILLLDIMLPDTDGLSILKEINGWLPADRPDVIVLSGHDDPEVTFESLRSGAVDFIRKPFHHEEFLLRVAAVAQLRYFRYSNEACQLLLETVLRKLSRFFCNDLIHAILDGTISADTGGELAEAAFFVFDLRSSTHLAEKLGPVVFFKFLSDFFAKITDIIYTCNGSINKFMGDGFLVTFGLRKYTEKATLDAVDCAMKVRQFIGEYNKARPDYLEENIGYGVGITTGEVFAGNIGGMHKLDYTIFGDAVNLASRLESMTKQAQVDILIDKRTREICGERLKVKRLQTTSVRGKSEAVTIYHPEELRRVPA